MTKRLTRGRRGTMTLKNGKVVVAKPKPLLLLEGPKQTLFEDMPEISPAGKTRLGAFMRQFACTVTDPAQVQRLEHYADQLDLTVYSLGKTSGLDSLAAYRNARVAYEQIAETKYVPHPAP